jgi:hypothetical protein
MENKLNDFLIRNILTFCNEAAFQCFFAYRRDVDAATIVRQRQHHFPPFTGQRQRCDTTLRRLACRRTTGRIFEAMVNRITQHVLQRRDDTFKQTYGPFHLLD